MKTLLIILLLISPVLAQQVSTFNGHEAEWGWSGKDYSKSAVIKILQENWGKVSPLDLQKKVDVVTSAEFLWKITPDLVDQALSSSSTFVVGGAKVEGMVITLEASGRGEITLISQGNTVGRTRCQSAATRKGKNSQIVEGGHKVLGKEEIHTSKEFRGAKMPKALLLDASTGIYIHCGDLSSISGGCIRVSEPAGRELFRLISVGTLVKVVWKK